MELDVICGILENKNRGKTVKQKEDLRNISKNISNLYIH